MLANPAKSAGAGIALADGVRSNKAKGAIFADECESAAEEMGNDVSVPVRSIVQVENQLEIPLPG